MHLVTLIHRDFSKKSNIYSIEKQNIYTTNYIIQNILYIWVFLVYVFVLI